MNEFYSREAEQAVLGSALINNDVLDSVFATVKKEYFFDVKHQMIFEKMFELFGNNIAVDAIVLAESLGENLVKVGGGEYLGVLYENTPTYKNIDFYIGIVVEKWRRRQLNGVFSDAILKLKDSEVEALDVADEVNGEIEKIGEEKSDANIEGVVKSVLSKLDLVQSSDGFIGVPTGYPAIDSQLLGLQQTDLYILAARPAMGKTSLALNIAHNVLSNGGRVVFFSLEMSSEQLVMRLISSITGIDSSLLRRKANLTDSEWENIVNAASWIEASKLEIITDVSAPSRVDAALKRIKKNGGIDLVIVDYLQLMEEPKLTADGRVNEVSGISRRLKRTAVNLDVPMLVLSQLNRQLENSQNKRPALPHLRDSGSIEQDADVVLFIYRDEVYNADSPDAGTAEIIISKNRHGPIFMARLGFNGATTQFHNLN